MLLFAWCLNILLHKMVLEVSFGFGCLFGYGIGCAFLRTILRVRSYLLCLVD